MPTTLAALPRRTRPAQRAVRTEQLRPEDLLNGPATQLIEFSGPVNDPEIRPEADQRPAQRIEHGAEPMQDQRAAHRRGAVIPVIACRLRQRPLRGAT